MSDTPRTDAQACHVSVDRAGCITLSYSKDGGYVPRLLSERLERENAALRADVLEQCTLNAKGSEREYSLRGRIEQLERENATLRSLLREAIMEHVDPYDLREGDHYIARAKAVLGIPPTQEAVVAARAKEGQP